MSDGWAEYWTGAGAREGGCLPDAAGGARPLLEQLWRDFARGLPAKARLLDLATGDGAVLRMIQAARRDLALVGVDSAPGLPRAPAGIRLRAGIAMEALPFADESFHAVTSQFGIEYGDVGRIATGMVRILKPGGRMRAVIHHSDGVIVRHNAGRHSALAWAAEQSGLVERARKLAGARVMAALPTPPSFRAAVAQARQLFPEQTVGSEFAAAIVSTLDMGLARPPRETLEVLDTLEAQARGEMQRLGALARAAMDERGIEALAGRLTAAGLEVSSPRPLAQPPAGSALIAWVVDAAKA